MEHPPGHSDNGPASPPFLPPPPVRSGAYDYNESPPPSVNSAANSAANSTLKIRFFFRNRYGHFRFIWRFLFYALVCGAFMWGARHLRSLLRLSFDGIIGEYIHLIMYHALGITAFLVPAWMLLKWPDRRPLKLLGLGFAWADVKELVAGVLLGGVHVVLVVLPLWAGGWLTLAVGAWDRDLGENALTLLVVLFLAAAFEEAVFRGYVFQAFCEGTRRWIGVVVFGLLFAFFHGVNPGIGVLGLINLSLCGVFFGVAYLKTRSLWFVFGVHMAWNWTQAVVFGVRVSGWDLGQSVLVSGLDGASVFTGGSFGLEGSLFYTLTIIPLIWLSGGTDLFKPFAGKAALWKSYPRGFRLDP